MSRIREKYQSLIILSIFTISMFLFVAVPLSVLKYFLDNVPIQVSLEFPIIAVFYTIIIGIIYCEINYIVKNVLVGSVIFGFTSSSVFLIVLKLSSLILGNELGTMPLAFYLFMIIIGGSLLSILYYKVSKN